MKKGRQVCPKCGSDLTSQWDIKRDGLWRCRMCNAIWTGWQQEEIERLMAICREIEESRQSYSVDKKYDMESYAAGTRDARRCAAAIAAKARGKE